MEQEFMHNYGKDIVGPVMLEYTRWILSESVKRGIKKLYFLARDGYLLSKIAKTIAIKQGLDIDCRYLYCSRASLRMPSYHIIPTEEMYDILLLGGYYVTPKSLLWRAEIEGENASLLYKELEIEDENACLNDQELEELRGKIKKSELYYNLVTEASKNAYKSTIDYFRSEGLFDTDHVAIADSGWTGSMQRSLRQLLDNEGYTGKITGFYFGMYVSPKPEDGEYCTYYFSKSEGAKRKLYFNNNLFECMLSAPHPMTIGYGYDEGGKVRPLFAENHSKKMLELINSQIDGALEYTSGALEVPFTDYNYKRSLKRVYRLLKRAMVKPTRAEANALSDFTFCDDVTEKYRLSLASDEMKKSLKNYMLIGRVLRKLTGKKQSGEAQLFWPYGVVSLCPKILRPWYRFNITLWDFLKIKLKK